ncbi:MAG TPA: hypothetical protein VL495_03725 [Edaphobacter sp.]|nr:hypothetical protein [Edaphobacter sp.]
MNVTRASIQWAALAGVLAFGLSGCRHKAVIPPLPAISQPVALINIPESVQTIQAPEIDLPPVPMASGLPTHRERRRRTTTPIVAGTPSNQPAEDTTTPVSPEDAAIGSLSLGGESNPRVQQEATDLIASNEKRLGNLRPHNSAERSQVNRIRNFQRQAQDALKSGDVEGARTLATKAKLLLDDLDR